MFSKNSRRLAPEVNASSMADIAFLLLVFFLVTTEISVETGLLVRLPVWDDDPQQEVIDIRTNNLFSVKVNGQNQLLIRKQPAVVGEVRARAIEFITNPEQRSDLASKPTKAVISLQNDRQTNYATYLAVYNELLGAYHDIWQAEAERRFAVAYEDLPDEGKRQIRGDFPLILSEAEPTDHFQR